MLSTEVCFNPSVYFSITHTTLWSLPLMNSRSIFTPTCPTLALTSNIYILPTSSPSLPTPPILLFSIKYLYHIRQNSPHTYAIFFPYIVLECRHNIRNQPVSTAIPSPNSFLSIFLQESMALRQIRLTGKHY